MTILQLISSEGFYGAESMLVTLSWALEQLGDELIVGVFEDQRNPHTEVAEVAKRRGLTVELLTCQGRLDWSAVRKLRSLLEIHAVDILHTHGYKADIYGYFASRSREVALVSTCHNWPNPAATMQFYAVANRLVLRRFQQVTTPSAKVMQILTQSGISSSNVTLIANGVDISRFEDATPTLQKDFNPDGKQIIGIIGRLVNEKGGTVLLEAAKKVLNQYADVLFVFVGEGEARQDWQALSQHLGIAASVVFTGSRGDMPGVLASCNIIAMPSFNEAMPMTLLEAMAATKPVIATSVGAIPELIQHNKTGYLVPPRNVEALAEGLLALLRDPTMAQQLGKNGNARVKEHFSANAMARQYSNVYGKARTGFKEVVRAQKAENN